MARPANEINPGERLEPVYVLASDKKRIRKHKRKMNAQSDSAVVHKALDKLEEK